MTRTIADHGKLSPKWALPSLNWSRTEAQVLVWARLSLPRVYMLSFSPVTSRSPSQHGPQLELYASIRSKMVNRQPSMLFCSIQPSLLLRSASCVSYPLSSISRLWAAGHQKLGYGSETISATSLLDFLWPVATRMPALTISPSLYQWGYSIVFNVSGIDTPWNMSLRREAS